MVSPSDAMYSVALAIDSSGIMPDGMSYLLHEADLQNDDADVDLPLIEITPVEADNVHPSNTDLVGYTTDDDGNRTGRVYHSEYQLTAEVNIWTGANGQYDVDELGDALRKALYPHSSYGPQEPFIDEDGDEVGIFRFVVESGERDDNVIRTPTVRRWRQEVELWAYEDFKTTEDYVVDVIPPSGDNQL